MNPFITTTSNSNWLSSDVQWRLFTIGHDDGFDDGGASVREPRRPSPNSPLAGAMAMREEAL